MVLHHTEYISKETYSKAKYTYNIQILIYNVKPYIANKNTESFKRDTTTLKPDPSQHTLSPHLKRGKWRKNLNEDEGAIFTLFDGFETKSILTHQTIPFEEGEMEEESE